MDPPRIRTEAETGLRRARPVALPNEMLRPFGCLTAGMPVCHRIASSTVNREPDIDKQPPLIQRSPRGMWLTARAGMRKGGVVGVLLWANVAAYAALRVLTVVRVVRVPRRVAADIASHQGGPAVVPGRPRSRMLAKGRGFCG